MLFAYPEGFAHDLFPFHFMFSRHRLAAEQHSTHERFIARRSIRLRDANDFMSREHPNEINAICRHLEQTSV